MERDAALPAVDALVWFAVQLVITVIEPDNPAAGPHARDPAAPRLDIPVEALPD